MFFRSVMPRLYHGVRWGGPRCPRRWLANRGGDVPIRIRNAFPWRGFWGFPHPLRSFERIERDFEDMFRLMNSAWFPRYRERYAAGEMTTRAPEIQVNYDDKTFEVSLKVDSYQPDDLEVKVLDDRLVISGKVEKLLDEHGSVTSQFTRQIQIPEDVDPDTVTCDLDDDGVLSIQARIKGVEPSSERVINIERKSSAGDDGKPKADL